MTRTDLATPAFKAANELTARWVESVALGHTVVSGACVWPLLALLQSGASGRTLDELTAATGVAPDIALASGLGVMRAIQRIPDAGAALGLWVRDGVPLRASWATGMPEGVVRALPVSLREASQQLDHWTRENTGGLIDRLPIGLTDETLLVLAAAIFTKLKWLKPYDTAPMRFNGEEILGLSATAHDLTLFAMIDWHGLPVGRYVSQGDGRVDVHLLTSAEGVAPSATLRAGIEALTGTAPVTPGDELVEGDTAGCLTVRLMEGRADLGLVHTPAFEIASTHDLTKTPEVFGIRAALDARAGHFPGIADESTCPLCIDQAGQSAVARFHRLGFEAAAVTAFSLTFGASRDPKPQRVKVISMDLDRPFGFLAVDRSTKLVLFAGWVTTPAVVAGNPLDEFEGWERFEGLERHELN
jgi:serine protease inhibitor